MWTGQIAPQKQKGGLVLCQVFGIVYPQFCRVRCE